MPHRLPPYLESERLAVLDSYKILDTPAEAGFDDIVLLARQICQTPVALVSLVAKERQWFKAASGFELCETPLSQSVCAHALQQAGTLIIPDLTQDERTKSNTLVTEAPYIRFYAGALLRTASGIPLGTICVIDIIPRPEGLTPDQTSALEALARQVMTHLEHRRSLIALAASEGELRNAAEASTARAFESERLYALLRMNEARLRLAQEASSIGSFEIDIANNQLEVSEQFCRIFGLPIRQRFNASEIEQLVHPEDAERMSSDRTRKDASAALLVEYRIVRPDDHRVVWISRRGQFVRDALGKPVRLIGMVQDVTERKELEARQKVLNEELSHRMKNTLAMVQAIARQTLRDSNDRAGLEAFGRRIGAMSQAHDILLKQSWLAADLRELVFSVLFLHGDREKFLLDGPKLSVGPRAALSFSLLLHELATNAVKYGALSVPSGRVSIDWSIDGAHLVFRWIERGGPSSLEPAAASFGTRLIDMGIAGSGEVSRSYGPEGLSVEIRTLLRAVQDVAPADAAGS